MPFFCFFKKSFFFLKFQKVQRNARQSAQKDAESANAFKTGRCPDRRPDRKNRPGGARMILLTFIGLKQKIVRHKYIKYFLDF